jgi:nucleoid DNA-binding protein
MGKLTIQEVSKILTEKNGLEPREASRFAAEMFAIILQRLQDGEAVKVKGLGTFKIINVEARESVSVRTGERVVIDSHSKVSFTPDTLMRELVNKPFSQFETVVLNDGVAFEDIKDEVAEEAAEAPVAEEEPVAAPVEDPVVEEGPAVEEEPVVAEEPVVEEKPVVAEEPVVEEEPVAAPVENPVVEEEPAVEEKTVVAEEPVKEEPELIDFYEEEKPKRNWMHWLIACAVALILVLVAGYGGYQLGNQQVMLVPDTIVVRDTVYMAEVQDTLEGENAEEAIFKEMVAESDEQSEPKAEPQQETVDQWAAKDERVRLGAYRIVGLLREVTVLEGQTFYSICRAQLGPDMQCYVEVYNGLPRNPQIKTGQVLKIPKLERKSRRK